MDDNVSGYARTVKGGTAAGRQPAPSGDLAFHLEDEAPLLLPEGEYVAVFARARKRCQYERQVLELVFELLEDGHGHMIPEGTKLSMFCRLGADGRPGRSSKFVQAWMLVAGRRPGRQRMSTTIFRGRLVRCVVRTVTKDQRQRKRTDLDAYSVIDRLVASGAGVRP